MRRTHKYNATKTEVDGIKFDSKAEARRYQTLKEMEENGEITDLTTQPKFELQTSYTNGTGQKIRSIAYVADFSYVDKNGQRVIEDVKSEATKTQVYRVKKKLFEKIYHPITIKEVQR